MGVDHLPLPVTLNRFFAADFVFILGIWLSIQDGEPSETLFSASERLFRLRMSEKQTATAALLSRAV